MSGNLPVPVLLSVVVIMTAAILGALAYRCARRRAAGRFVALVVLAWLCIGAVGGYYASVSTDYPGRIAIWRRIADVLVSTSPLALIPSALLLLCVVGVVPTRWIPLIALVGAIAALPIAAMVALASSCYIALDCP